MSPLPDPSTDMPTTWAPLSAGGAQPTSDSGRNTLALVSLLTSLVFPLATAINVLGAVAFANHLIPQKAMIVFVMIGGGIGTFSIPAMLMAIVIGHVALVRAKQFSRRSARRWMAVAGLGLGYLSLLAIASVMALFIIAGMHGF